LFVLGTG